LTLYIFHIDLNYTACRLIMLIGIVKKNAIMMIDFALEVEAPACARAGDLRRLPRALQPIMMTPSPPVGTLPIAIGFGPAAIPPAARPCRSRWPAHLAVLTLYSPP